MFSIESGYQSSCTTTIKDNCETMLSELFQKMVRIGNVLEARGIILRGIIGNVPFTFTNFNLKIYYMS